MPKLLALDLPIGEELRTMTVRAWDRGDVVLPLDQRMMPSVRRRLAMQLGADAIASLNGTESLPSPRHAVLQTLEEGDAVVIATSGSTGEPKGVVHTHASLIAHADIVGRRLELGASDHWWMCLPAAHIGGFGVMMRAMHHHSTITFCAQPDERSLRAALADGATHTAMVPTLVARHALEGWRLVLVGGSQSGVLPPNAVATYGLTETCGGVVYDGIPLPGVDLKLRDGEVLIRTPTLARTYRHAPLSLQDGWLATGDLGGLANGVLRVDGRKDDLIITGGHKVWPYVVERRLREHPLVRDVVVRGVPDNEWGFIVRAYVVAREQNALPTLDVLRGHVKETLAAYCAPRQLVLLDAIPRTALGKVVLDSLPA